MEKNRWPLHTMSLKTSSISSKNYITTHHGSRWVSYQKYIIICVDIFWMVTHMFFFSGFDWESDSKTISTSKKSEAQRKMWKRCLKKEPLGKKQTLRKKKSKKTWQTNWTKSEKWKKWMQSKAKQRENSMDTSA